MHVQDDLYLGPTKFGSFLRTNQDNPTQQLGVGPLGRIYGYDIVPLTIQTANVAALQGSTNGVGFTLAAGTGATKVAAPDGSGNSVIQFDVPRCVSFTSGSNLSAINYTVKGFDFYGVPMTQTRAGANVNTVNTTKAFFSVLSVTPNNTSASTMSIGTSDIFGLPWAIADKGYCAGVRWNNTLAQDTGTLTNADATSPATASTGDVRGTYAPSAGASDGAKRLVFLQLLAENQIGPLSAVLANLIGVTQF